MCNGGACREGCGEQQFARYDQEQQPGQLLFPQGTVPTQPTYAVLAHHAAHQWEIVAVKAGHTRHVAYVSTVCCLDKVMDMAQCLARGQAAVAQ